MQTTAAEDSVTMICPNLACQRTVCAPHSARGMVVRCAYCEVPFRVPQAKPVAEETAPASAESGGRRK